MQLDVKHPLDMVKITNALDLAKEGRRAILNAMEDECEITLPGLQPRTSMKSTAPRVVSSFHVQLEYHLTSTEGKTTYNCLFIRRLFDLIPIESGI